MAEQGERRKRPRAARACELCRAKKYRCDEMEPCGRCSKLQVDCVYVGASAFRSRTNRDRTDCQTITDLHNVQSSTGALIGGAISSTGEEDGSSSLISRPLHTVGTALPSTLDAQAGEIIEFNPHTLDQEFHGLTSPLVVIAALQRCTQEDGDDESTPQFQRLQSSISDLHNDTFSLGSTFGQDSGSTHASSRFYFRQSRPFLDGYFQNLHFIHPFIDQSHFMSQCEALWFGGTQAVQSSSFVALYLAVMSLGALTREWTEEEAIDGKNRLEWARELFRQAAVALGPFPIRTDLYSVQASIIMAKICQNELTPHLAYMYLGLAVRTSLSAGYNREHGASSGSFTSSQGSIAKTWWALYSLEIEMSFALGRADSLGLDVYHNVSLPSGGYQTETGIISHMIEFARIIRTVSACVYIPDLSISRRMESARDIEDRMNTWIKHLPTSVQPDLNETIENLGMTRDPMWAKKQRHTLKFRYYNVRMILYMPFLLHAGHTSPNDGAVDTDHLNVAASKCLDAAESTLRLMHHLFSTASYFRTWWYNTTYILYATSIVFHRAIRFTPSQEKTRLLELVDMSIEMLNVMDEVVVAKKAATLLQQTADRVRHRDELANSDPPILRGQDQFSQHATNNSSRDNMATMPSLLEWLWNDPLDSSAQDFLLKF